MHKPHLHLAAAALSLLAAIAASPADARERLRIATEGAFAPWNATGPNGQLVGFEIDLARDLCRRMDTDCDIVAHDWDGILPGLDQKRYDAVIAGVMITEERARRVDFTQAYATDPAVFAVRRGSPLAAALPAPERIDLSGDEEAARAAVTAIGAVLAGRVVAVQTSTTHAQMLAQLFPGVSVRAYDTIDQAAFDLAAGRVDALLSAQTVLTALNADGSLQPIGPSFTRGPIGQGAGMAVRKGNDKLRARLDRAIAAAIADGTTARLSDRWFHFDVSP